MHLAASSAPVAVKHRAVTRSTKVGISVCIHTHRGVGQNNGKTTDIVHKFFINVALDDLLPSIQPQSFLEKTRTSFEQFLAKFYTILLKEHLQVVLEMLEVGIHSSF
jgi:hypothetical protein